MFMRSLFMFFTIITVLSGCIYNASTPENSTIEENMSKSEQQKDVMINVYSYEQDSVTKIIDNEEYQKTLKDILDTDDWIMKLDASDDGLEKKAELIVYQERTKMANDESDTSENYEEIARYIIFNNSSCVGMSISPGVVKNMYLPSSLRFILYEIPDTQLTTLKSYIE